jgi:hypothetical protein
MLDSGSHVRHLCHRAFLCHISFYLISEKQIESEGFWGFGVIADKAGSGYNSVVARITGCLDGISSAVRHLPQERQRHIMQNLDAFRELISSPKNIVITTHYKPDAEIPPVGIYR